MTKKNKILIIRLSSIGDVVLTTPLVRVLYKMGYEIDYLIKPTFSDVLIGNPYINKLLYYTPGVERKFCQLDAPKYKYIIDLQNNLRSRKLTLTLGIPTLRLNKINLRKWLMTSLKINVLPSTHIVDRYIQTARKLGARNDGKGLDFFLYEKDIPSEKLLGSLPFVVMAVGAAHITKAIPIELGAKILQKLDYPVIIIGALTDWDSAHQMIVQSGKTNIRNLCGKLSIRGSAGVISKAEAVIAPDTGMMHIAAAFKKPIAIVWGNTIPAFGMGPYYGDASVPSLHFEVPGLSCRPCSKLGFNQCPKGGFQCMLGQDASGIAASISQLVETI